MPAASAVASANEGGMRAWVIRADVASGSLSFQTPATRKMAASNTEQSHPAMLFHAGKSSA